MEEFVQISGGFADYFKVDFDHKKFLGHPKTKEGIHCFAVAAKDAAKAPFDVDDRVIDATVSAVDAILDNYKSQPAGPMVVGSSGENVVMLKKYRSKEEAEKLLRENGVTQFAPWVLLIVQLLPTLVDVLKYIKDLLGK